VFGTVTKLGDGSMTLQGSNNTQTVVAFNSGTIVLISGSAAKASDLKVGMRAAAWVKASKPATKIYAYLPK
jgi:molybdopterin-binding protein